MFICAEILNSMKPVRFFGDPRESLRGFPKDAQQDAGYQIAPWGAACGDAACEQCLLALNRMVSGANTGDAETKRDPLRTLLALGLARSWWLALPKSPKSESPNDPARAP